MDVMKHTYMTATRSLDSLFARDMLNGGSLSARVVNFAEPACLPIFVTKTHHPIESDGPVSIFRIRMTA